MFSTWSLIFSQFSLNCIILQLNVHKLVILYCRPLSVGAVKFFTWIGLGIYLQCILKYMYVCISSDKENCLNKVVKSLCYLTITLLFRFSEKHMINECCFKWNQMFWKIHLFRIYFSRFFIFLFENLVFKQHIFLCLFIIHLYHIIIKLLLYEPL